MMLTTIGIISLIAGIIHFVGTLLLSKHPLGRLIPLELSFVGVMIFLVSQIYIDYSLAQASLFFLLGVICIAGFLFSLLAIATIMAKKSS